jgi:Bax protein
MDKLNKFWPIILAVAIIAIVLMIYQFLKLRLEAPDFVAIEDVKVRQEKFLDYFGRTAQQVNAAIMRDREKIEKIIADPAKMSTKGGWLIARASQYGVTGEVTPAFFEELLKRADVLPPAMVLSQGALESGWGTSRFAVEGNNFFGQKCFNKGCGIVPQNRGADQTFEMSIFDTPFDSVNAYIFNINTHDAYARLRETRARLRKNNQPITGKALVTELESYSENGADHIRDIRRMMETYRLDETYGILAERAQ